MFSSNFCEFFQKIPLTEYPRVTVFHDVQERCCSGFMIDSE